MIKLAKLLILLPLFATTACAKEAKSPIQSSDTQLKASEHDDKITLKALTFKGKSPGDGKACTLSIASINQGGHHKLVAKVGYQMHDLTPFDTVVNFQRYNPNTNTFYPMSSSAPNTSPALVSVVLNDKNIKVDYNKLYAKGNSLGYADRHLLAQSFIAEFADDYFIVALKDVLEGKSTYESNKNYLDQLDFLTVTMYHVNHPDTFNCMMFKPTGMKTTVFELDADHDDHNH